ncbi:hypothetical protein [Kordiimonas aquimaris]|uniref:hypothetical protein n=1 Tax=Kordiimonas aquimaris TaxID=707591 RepID=UPI0021D164A0|nr:hypothetical protein [Kordiimonas aquimaris]
MFTTLWIFVRRLLWGVLALFLILFAVNNRESVVLSLEPLGFVGPMPLFVLLFIGVFIGLISAAGVTGWLRLQGFARRRKAERRADHLEEQVTALSEDAHQHRANKAHAAATDAVSIGDK